MFCAPGIRRERILWKHDECAVDPKLRRVRMTEDRKEADEVEDQSMTSIVKESDVVKVR